MAADRLGREVPQFQIGRADTPAALAIQQQAAAIGRPAHLCHVGDLLGQLHAADRVGGELIAEGAVTFHIQRRAALQPVAAGEQSVTVDGQGESAVGGNGALAQEKPAVVLPYRQHGQDNNGQDGGRRTATAACLLLDIVDMGDVHYGLYGGRGRGDGWGGVFQ